MSAAAITAEVLKKEVAQRTSAIPSSDHYFKFFVMPRLVNKARAFTTQMRILLDTLDGETVSQHHLSSPQTSKLISCRRSQSSNELARMMTPPKDCAMTFALDFSNAPQPGQPSTTMATTTTATTPTPRFNALSKEQPATLASPPPNPSALSSPAYIAQTPSTPSNEWSKHSSHAIFPWPQSSLPPLSSTPLAACRWWPRCLRRLASTNVYFTVVDGMRRSSCCGKHTTFGCGGKICLHC